MQDSLFFRFGKLIYKLRVHIVWLSIILIILCLPYLPNIMKPFQSTGFIDATSNSAKAENYLNNKLGLSSNQILVLYTSEKWLATDSRFKNAIKKSLSGLKDLPINYEIIYPDANKKQISKDKHTAYAVIFFDHDQVIDKNLIKDLENSIKTPPNMTMQLGGEAIFEEVIHKQTQKDLYKADLVAAPVSVITLILVFGTLIAALIPIVLGGGCALIILSLLYFIGQTYTLSIFTINIALLLGLCLCLDYCLFIISRFRDELRKNKAIRRVTATTIATAGKAVFFSGLAVFISLSALLFFPINILFSVGVGGLTAVFVAVCVSVILLPAILAILRNGINYLSIRLSQKEKASLAWRWLARKVVKRPLSFFLLTLSLLLLLGYPFLNAKFGISNFRILPQHSQGRAFFNTYVDKFNEQDLTPILLIVTSQKDPILFKANIAKLYDLVKTLKKNPLIDHINSIVNTSSSLTKSQYQTLYNTKSTLDTESIKSLLATTTTKYATVINIISKYDANSKETKTLISQLRALKPPSGWDFQLTGGPVKNEDVLNKIYSLFPYTVLWIIGLTYLVLLILLRSLFLPLKAILMNIVSLCASYGVLVFIFQEGHLQKWLNFDPQGSLDISLLVIIFCALFGFSMDYEVFLLTRIKEYYEQTKDNENSIIFGIEKSSKIITSAALIVIFLCGSFMVADVLMVKQFGLGIAAAIFVDAFLIRTLLVPATMALVKPLNWYLPKWLEKILPKW
ncbi:MMPL family transporter [Legionella gresilensis]|uniref:MMPL family transporter n=1 Tax=Legionella gresilensis TaxID=91823 RepID=UPI00104130B7|nr:MMPL family transporter [Legionella gresilensis]